MFFGERALVSKSAVYRKAVTTQLNTDLTHPCSVESPSFKGLKTFKSVEHNVKVCPTYHEFGAQYQALYNRQIL